MKPLKGSLDCTSPPLAGPGKPRRQHFTAWLRESRLPLHRKLSARAAAQTTVPSPGARLEDLPVELIADVCAFAGKRANGRLALASRTLHHKALPSLYRFRAGSNH